jgi:hypothetical protein
VAKQSGLGDNFYFDGVDLSGDVGAVQTIRDAGALLDSTAIDKSAMERMVGLADSEISFNAFFNDAAAAAHVTLRNPASTDIIATYARGTTLGNPGACHVAKQVNYDPSRGADGSLVFTIQTLGSNGDGLRWGRQITAGKRTDGSATNGASIDDAAASSFGLVAYLHVFAFTGTSVTVKLQESSDDGSGDAFADVTGGGFTAATGVTSERIATATNLSVERYLRCVTTGTFSNAVFSVVVARRAATF